MVLSLSDGTMRELFVQSGEHKFARPEYEYDMDDLELFISYLQLSLSWDIPDTEIPAEWLNMMATMLPSYLLGEWQHQAQLPNFLDRPIEEGTYITDVWSIVTPDIGKADNSDWLWLANRIINS